MRSTMKLYLGNKLILKCKLIHEPEGRRQRLIWGRREAESRREREEVEGEDGEKMGKMKGKGCRKLLLRKVKKWFGNAEREKQ